VNSPDLQSDIADRAVEVRGLCVAAPKSGARIVEDASFEVSPGEILGVVGESGSGKTTLGLALLNHCRQGLEIEGGGVRINGHNLFEQSRGELQQLRGRLVCYVPQDPATALNPALRIRTQLSECIDQASVADGRSIEELLEEVMLPAAPGFLDAFPHQLSGGQMQRVAIAMAFANRPRLIVMDEPTTGLDVTTQAHVLKTVKRLCAHHNVAAVYVSHDMAVIASIAHRTAVVYAGRIVEIGPTERVFHDPSHPYTRALIGAVPDIDGDRGVTGISGQAPVTGADLVRCSFAPRCGLAVESCWRTVPQPVLIEPGHEVRCLRPEAREDGLSNPLQPLRDARAQPVPILQGKSVTAFYGPVEVLHGLSFDVAEGECLGVVGTSGSGKSTLARTIAGLHEETGGRMLYRDRPLAGGWRRRDAVALKAIQYIFQNPYGSMNPRRSVGRSIAIALSRFSRQSSTELRRKVMAVLDQVSLPASIADRYPSELSGGQRQRAAIARALIVEPELLICDEITSALDVSVQARIMELLFALQRERGLTIIFVSHNLAVMRSIAQRLLVMQNGTIAESGPTEEILKRPQAAITRQLLQDTPRFSHSSPSGLEVRDAG
jgi:peptide/nickel transport system ATP-binding protein